MSAAPNFERILTREGLGSLDFSDGAGGIAVGNRGSGKMLDETRAAARASASERLTARKAMIAQHLETHVYAPGDVEPRVLRLYAAGLGNRRIADRLGVGRMSVFRIVAKMEREHRARPPEMRLGELLADCEPTTIVLLFALLERALTAPREVGEAIGRARSVPEIRALLQPDEVRHE